MGTQPEQGTFDATVYSYETTDPVKGGIGGTANAPLLNLANRTGWLKAQVASLVSQLALLAGLNSPTFTGSPRAPTAAPGDSSTLISNTAFVQGAVNGQAVVALTSGTLTLSQAQYGCSIIHLTGTLTGPVTLLFPGQTGRYSVIDDTSGSFPISMKTPTGPGVCLTIHGQAVDITSDGANLRYVGGAALAVINGDLNLYVSTNGSDTGRTGLDSNNPFFSASAALAYAFAYYRGTGGNLIINLLAGTYGQSGCVALGLEAPPGFAQVVINGAGAGSTALVGYAGQTTLAFAGGCIATVQNLSLGAAGGANATFVSSGAVLGLNNVTFTGAGAGSHLVAAGGGTINLGAGIVVSGGGSSLFVAGPGGALHAPSQTITFQNTPNFTSCVASCAGGVLELTSVVYNGLATGTRFLVQDNGIIATGSANPLTGIMGSLPGVCASGGVIDSATASGLRTVLSANLTLYVDGANGSDLGIGTTSGAGAFATLQAACNALSNGYDGAGHAATLQIANGTYASSQLGDTVGFSNITITGAGSGCIMGGGLVFSGGVGTVVQDVTLQNSNGACLSGFNGCNVSVNNVIFAGAGTGAHILCETGSTINLATYTVAGNAGSHINCTNGGLVQVNNTTVTLSGSLSITTFIISEGSSTVIFSNVGIGGSGSVTGQKYLVGLNACLLTYGSNGTNVPGSTAGAATQGGQLT